MEATGKYDLGPDFKGAGRGTLSADAARMRFVLFAMALVAGSNIYGALTHAGPRFALVSTMFTFSVMLAYTLWKRDSVLAKWLTIGFIAGWLEIVADAWLVARTTSLVYPAGEPMVWKSPLYMPFAWTIVLAQLGLVAGWLSRKLSFGWATLASALLGGLMIPFYEQMAHDAGYWWYLDTPMVMNAPLYIIVAEFLLSLPLVWMYLHGLHRRRSYSAFLGLVLGVWMVPSVVIAWRLVGPCQGAWIQFACR